MLLESQLWQGEGLARAPGILHASWHADQSEFEKMAEKLGMDEDECMQVLHLAQDVVDQVRDFDKSASRFSFFRIGGSLSQGLALSGSMSDIDVVCFVKTEGGAVGPQMKAALQTLKDFVYETPWMELISAETTLRTISAWVKPYNQWCTGSFSVDFVLAHDLAHTYEIDLQTYPLTQPLTMRNARQLHGVFYASVPTLLRNEYDEDTIGSDVSWVRDVARSYIDCATSFARSLRPDVKHACLILKTASNLCRDQRVKDMGASCIDGDLSGFKNKYLRSYGIMHLVVVIDQYMRKGRMNKPSSSLGVKELLLQTCHVILYLDRFFRQKTYLFQVDKDIGFYDASKWNGKFPMARKASPMAIRDLLNPVNDVVRKTDWKSIVGMARALLHEGLLTQIHLLRLPKNVSHLHYWGRSFDDEDYAEHYGVDESTSVSLASFESKCTHPYRADEWQQYRPQFGRVSLT